MSNSVESSIIIPVFNQWQLTRPCLLALKDTLAGKVCEIIVVDNGSTDATVEECPRLGEELFGTLFCYHRSDVNLNFGPASNLGAKLAKGNFLIFLNNDTIPLPGWYEPLLDDFAKFPDIAATGPLLLYPEREPFGFTVQHLGVFVSPTLKLGHLYEGIPADSVLVKKRRFFQVITAACMVLRRSLFHEIGMFDEAYTNGFEDADLCARLWQAGYKMTVNSDARVIHHTSQTPGRHTHEKENSAQLISKTLHLLIPDWHIHLANDGLILRVSPWQALQGSLPTGEQYELLSRFAAVSSLDEIKNTLLRFPLWEEGYAALIQQMKAQGADTESLELSCCKLWPSPPSLLELHETACKNRSQQTATFALSVLMSFCKSYEAYVAQAQEMLQWAGEIGVNKLAERYEAWLAQREEFRTQQFLPFLGSLRNLMQSFSFSPGSNWAYTLWRELADQPSRMLPEANILHTHEGAITFSVLMPVYNPKPEHLSAAVDSLLSQSYPHWELCIADDASPEPHVRTILEELIRKDARIRVVYREENGHIAAATNTALSMARYRYAALMDQDDLLTPDAFQVVAKAIAEHPEGLLFYSDEDKIADGGDIFFPYFKNNSWDVDLLLGQNMVNHLGVYTTERLRGIGGFREGFNGAQDYDMLLRYTEGVAPSYFIHIPKVLYHWRAHADSTAADIGAKPEVLGSAVRALEQHLDRMGIAGDVELNGQYSRIRYTLPKPLPLVSLIIDLDSGCTLAPSLAQALTGKTGYTKLEIIFVYDAESEPKHIAQLERWASTQRQVKLLPQKKGLSYGIRRNAANSMANGKLLGFLDPKIIPLSANWLEEMVSRLLQPGVAVLGGRIIDQRGKVYHQGYSTDATGRLFSFSRDADCADPGYFAWLALARTVTAVEPRCLLTHKVYLDELNGFGPHLGGVGAIDFCLRLKEKGLRSVATPFAEFLLLDSAEENSSAYKAVDWESGIFVNDAYLYKYWRGWLKPCNPNLDAGVGTWFLHWADERDNHPDECLSATARPVAPSRKILFVAHDCFKTGAPYSLLRLMRWLQKNTDYAMGVLALLGGPLQEEFESIGPVEVVRDHKAFQAFGPRPTLVEVEQALPRLLRQMGGKPDCILGNTAVSPLAYPALSDLQVPVITRVAELPDVIKRFVQPQIIREMLIHTDHFVAVSPPVRDMIHIMGALGEQISIIQGGIEQYPTELDAARRANLLQSLGFRLDIPVLWGCGTLGITKGADLFYDACLKLHLSGITDFQAIWVGKPDGTVPGWEAHHMALRGKNLIATPGYIETPYLLMKPGDIFLLTSREDPFPLVALEAAERGVPIVAFEGSGGMDDVIAQGAGVFAKYGDTQHMAEQVTKLLGNPHAAISIGQKGRQIVLENYTLDILGKKYVQLFESMTGENSKRQ